MRRARVTKHEFVQSNECELLPDSSVRLPPTQDVVPVQRSGKGNYEVVWAQADALYNPKKNYERQVFIQPGKERVMEYTMKQDGFEPSISIRLKTGKQLRIDRDRDAYLSDEEAAEYGKRVIPVIVREVAPAKKRRGRK